MSMTEISYRCYMKLGGIINEADYQSAIDRMRGACALDRREPQIINSIMQVKVMARYSGIALSDSEDASDPRIALYVILRGDIRPTGVKYHHDQMCDQRIFGEVLRMLGDTDSFEKLVKTHPHISFEYERRKTMNRKHKRRLVKAVHEVYDFPALDEYGSKIFGRPIRSSWRIFRNIVRMSVATDVWGWNNYRERASYPGKVEVPTFDEFATFLLHEVAHGWCYFLKDDLSIRDYPTGVDPERSREGSQCASTSYGVDEEQVCWDISKLACEMLGISYQEELAELSHQYYLFHLKWPDDLAGLERLEEKMPAYLKL